MANYKELMAQKAELEKLLVEARNQEISVVVTQIRAIVSEYDLTPSDVFPSKKSKGTEGVSPAKYRDPLTGATWSGKGKPPKWISGKDRTQFAI